MTYDSSHDSSHGGLYNSSNVGPINESHNIVIANDLCKYTYPNSDSCNKSSDCIWTDETNVNHFGKSIIVPASCTTKKIHE